MSEMTEDQYRQFRCIIDNDTDIKKWRRQWLDILKTNPTSRCSPDEKGVFQYHSSEEELILREKIENKANEIYKKVEG